jgi:hypothetical protein
MAALRAICARAIAHDDAPPVERNETMPAPDPGAQLRPAQPASSGRSSDKVMLVTSSRIQ